MNRRGLLKTAGMLAAAGALAGCDRGNVAQKTTATQTAAAAPDPTASLYPAKRNEAFEAGAGRDITREEIVSGYNNYYEFGVEKDDPAAYADRLPIRPWEISFEGLIEKPFKTDFDTLIKAMPLEERVYRHRCVETWAFVAPWSG